MSGGLNDVPPFSDFCGHTDAVDVAKLTAAIWSEIRAMACWPPYGPGVGPELSVDITMYNTLPEASGTGSSRSLLGSNGATQCPLCPNAATHDCAQHGGHTQMWSELDGITDVMRHGSIPTYGVNIAAFTGATSIKAQALIKISTGASPVVAGWGMIPTPNKQWGGHAARTWHWKQCLLHCIQDDGSAKFQDCREQCSPEELSCYKELDNTIRKAVAKYRFAVVGSTRERDALDMGEAPSMAIHKAPPSSDCQVHSQSRSVAWGQCPTLHDTSLAQAGLKTLDESRAWLRR